jgi:hypothetical protein
MDVTSKKSLSPSFVETERDVVGVVWADAAIEPARANSTAAEMSVQLIMFNTCVTRFLMTSFLSRNICSSLHSAFATFTFDVPRPGSSQ